MSDVERGVDDEEDVVSLVRLAGLRPVPSPLRATEVRAHVHAAWRSGIRRRRFRSSGLLLAAAALAAVALAITFRRGAGQEGLVVRVPAAPAAVAWLGAGSAEREVETGWAPLGAGEPLAAGSLVRTRGKGAAFSAEDGRSIRVGAESRLRFVGRDRLALEKGVVYVDSGRAASTPSSFEVQTAWGAVRETGTQFEVRLEPAELRVRVREGSVALLGRGPTLDVARGTELRVGERGATRRTIPVQGSEWSWVLALAPTFEMEGRSLHDLLVWAAREGGWELRYADAESRRRSEGAQLHGSIRGLAPDEALAAAIPSTGLPYRLESGVLRVGRAGPER
jgi:hypothetical protein